MLRARPAPSATFAWTGWRIEDCRGRRVGSLSAVYETEPGGAPTWFLVRLARYSSRYVLVPVADVLAAHGCVQLPWARRTIEQAPVFFSPPPVTTPALEDQLRRHFGIEGGGPAAIELVVRRTGT